jgi:hypothetical protein
VNKIIEIRYSKKFGGSWCVHEAPGVEPAFPGANGKQKAIEYARSSRFGGSRGEIHVYDESGVDIVETIAVDGGSRYDHRHRV